MNEDKWEKIDVVFKLKSPLHIGYMPFKESVVSPTRYYVPGRNLWGAITKRITEHLCKVPKADDYQKIGKQVMENFRFSYFYLCDGKTIYLPRYTDNGLKYGNITKAEFEHRFIGSIVSTGIDDETRTAKNKSLYEIEFINNRFRDENGDIKPVMIVGCIWIKKNAKIEQRDLEKKLGGIFIGGFNTISELILGGESKYGFGHVLLDQNKEIRFSDIPPFKWNNPEEIEINSERPIVAHLKYIKIKDIKFEGEVELLTGRGYYDPNELKDSNNEKQKFCMGNSSSKGKNNSKDNVNPGEVISRPIYYFSPGTVLKKLKEENGTGEKQEKSMICKLNWDGCIELNLQECEA